MGCVVHKSGDDLPKHSRTHARTYAREDSDPALHSAHSDTSPGRQRASSAGRPPAKRAAVQHHAEGHDSPHKGDGGVLGVGPAGRV